jgi:hypothetical protein
MSYAYFIQSRGEIAIFGLGNARRRYKTAGAAASAVAKQGYDRTLPFRKIFLNQERNGKRYLVHSKWINKEGHEKFIFLEY